jgi:hypothetical protein
MTTAKLTAALSPVQTLALTAWAEARSMLVPGKGWRPAPMRARACVVNVVLNRVKVGRLAWGGGTVKGVCLAPSQFSCWRPVQGEANYVALVALAEQVLAGTATDALYRECEALALVGVAGLLVDSTKGATHYYSPASMVPKGRVPAWAVGQTPVADVDGHLFFKGV